MCGNSEVMLVLQTVLEWVMQQDENIKEGLVVLKKYFQNLNRIKMQIVIKMR